MVCEIDMRYVAFCDPEDNELAKQIAQYIFNALEKEAQLKDFNIDVDQLV